MNNIDDINTPNKLLDYMNKNITYGFVGKNGNIYKDDWNDWFEQCIVQDGEQILKTKIGTCWDQVELERLWFEKHKYVFHTYFMWFEVNKENSYPTHTFLIFQDNNKFYWFEHAWYDMKGIHEFNSLSEAIEYVKSKQIEYTKINHSNASDEDMKCLTVYEYTKPNNNLNVEEYIKHVTNKKH